MKQVVMVNDVHSLIESLELQSKQEFYTIHGFNKTDDMCNVEFCFNKAKFIWNVNFLLRIKRFFNGDGNYQGSKYCECCLIDSCERLRTPIGYWKNLDVNVEDSK